MLSSGKFIPARNCVIIWTKVVDILDNCNNQVDEGNELDALQSYFWDAAGVFLKVGIKKALIQARICTNR